MEALLPIQRVGHVKVSAGRNGPRRRIDGRDYKRLKGKRQKEKGKGKKREGKRASRMKEMPLVGPLYISIYNDAD
jgi:hypothetical protein